jgi:hypothetical protein
MESASFTRVNTAKQEKPLSSVVEQQEYDNEKTSLRYSYSCDPLLSSNQTSMIKVYLMLPKHVQLNRKCTFRVTEK